MVIDDVRFVELIIVTTGVMVSGKGTAVVPSGPMYCHSTAGRTGEANTEQTKVTSSPTDVGESKTTVRISWSTSTKVCAAHYN